MNLPAPTTDTSTHGQPAPAQGFLAAWRWWLWPALLAVILALIFLDPFIGDWDALDYTILALHGEPSSMLFGRMLFIFTNRALYLIAHALFRLPPEKAYLLFKYMVVVQSSLVVIALWQLARDLTDSVRAATVAALLLAVSPFFILYSGQAMTEIQSLWLLIFALIIHLRGVRTRRAWMMLAGAALLGLSVNVREVGLLYAPWLVVAPFVCGWKLKRRELLIIALTCLVFMILACGPFALWYGLDIDNYRHHWHIWVESARYESARHPVSLANFQRLLLFFFIAAPLALIAFPVAAFREWKARGLSPLLALGTLGLFVNLLLILNYSVAINGRYLLTGIPALAPLIADYFVREQTAKWGNARRALISIVICLAITLAAFLRFLWPASSEYIANRSQTKDYIARLKLLPRDAVVMAGGQTIAVTYWRGIGSGEWDSIGTGGGWPGPQLITELETNLNAGRRVFLDMDPRWWSPCGWQLQEIHELLALESHFHFKRVSETIYEIKPIADETAHDAPNLSKLLPENRPDETKFCRN